MKNYVIVISEEAIKRMPEQAKFDMYQAAALVAHFDPDTQTGAVEKSRYGGKPQPGLTGFLAATSVISDELRTNLGH